MLRFTMVTEEDKKNNVGAYYGTVFSQATDGRGAIITPNNGRGTDAIMFAIKATDSMKNELTEAYNSVKNVLIYTPIIREKFGLVYICIHPEDRHIGEKVLRKLNYKYSIIEDYNNYRNFMLIYENIFG